MAENGLVDVSNGGAILLSPDIVCDGFLYGPKIRIQSHTHLDHMAGFDDSKAEHDIYLSQGAYDLLVHDKGFDIPCRSNIKVVQEQNRVTVGENRFSLLNSGHMLGAVQIEVKTKEGVRLGYSGDFQWPLEEVIQVEELVVDTTNGDPRFLYGYTQQDVDCRFVETISSLYLKGSLSLVAHRGTLQRALDLLDREGKYNIVATENTVSETKIYEHYGYSVPPMIVDSSQEGQKLLNDDKYIRIVRQGERRPSRSLKIPSLILSAYMSDPNEPLLQLSKDRYRISMSDHADFEGILEYVKSTGAKRVITDNTRGGNAAILANEITARLGIYCRPSSNFS